VAGGTLGRTRDPDRSEHAVTPRTATLRFDAALVALARGEVHEVATDGRRSVKDAVESLRVPHVEVASITVDGVGVDFAARIRGGEVIDVTGQHRPGTPALRPPPPRPFAALCDVHLGTLARRLRVLGLDVVYRCRADDAWLADRAVRESRVLLSRDRGLLSRSRVVHGMLPRSDDPDAQTLEVVERYRPPLAPATRCPRCNGVLEPVDRAEVWDRLPPRTRAAIDRYARCTSCGHLYWPGSHHEALTSLVARAREVVGDQ
jgi:uncharacterized protein